MVMCMDSSVKASGFRLMDEVSTMFSAGDVRAGMERLILGLRNIRRSYEADGWQKFALESFQEHPLTDLIFQDPFARHSFSKPRGYAGDAELLDFVYRHKCPPEEVTPLGKEIFHYFMETPGSKSVRSRRDVVAAKLDEFADSRSRPIRALSVACGHLREAHLSHALRAKDVDRLIALDQDAESLKRIREEFGDLPVQTVHSSVTALVRKKLVFENLDFVYSMGLYDYLSQPFAQKLTGVLFEMLRPGGKLLIANFVPDHREVGYMETFLQWSLIYRTKPELEDIAAEIEPSRIASRKTFWEENGNILFLELERA